MKFVVGLASAALLVSATTVSWAAAVIESSGTGVSAVTQSGNVGVDVGSGVDSRTRLVVASGRGAETVLRYEDGCSISLKPGQVYTVLDQSPCAAPSAPPPNPGPAAAAGLTSGIGATAVVGVVVAGAIAGGVVAATSGKGSSAPTVFISP